MTPAAIITAQAVAAVVLAVFSAVAWMVTK